MGNPVKDARDSQLTSGVVARSITSLATGSFDPFDSNRRKVFEPMLSPDTLPVIDPADSPGVSDWVTSCPFSVSTARRIAFGGPPTLIVAVSEVTKATTAVSGLVTE
jgi:hypothetical protein